jgi:hypothetical protein
VYILLSPTASFLFAFHWLSVSFPGGKTNYINTKKGVIDPDLNYNHRQAIEAYKISEH